MTQKTTTQRGRPKLIHGGFQYRIKRVSRMKTSGTCSVHGSSGKEPSPNDPGQYEI